MPYQDRVNLRSQKCNERFFGRFFNHTRRKINIIWYNYENKPVLYKTLERGQFVDINTFVSHPWIFVDYFTKERYVVNNKSEFVPQSRKSQSSQNSIVTRENVYITQPVYSLRELCIRKIKNCVDFEAVHKLDLPLTLKNDIYRAQQIDSLIDSIHRIT